ncbi:hypothetical protein [Nocardioides kribbensis]|uniref:DUF1992 domain-containing protein n=1 Tax=Nocardioides kribbensis TaxID=305517 RepID=A0ABV1NZ16_9ACTN
MSGMTGDEYMDLLLERQAEWERKHAGDPRRPWARPLLEWFIREGDDLLFTPPEEQPQPKRATQSRVYRSAASLRAERDRLVTQRAPLLTPILTDRAAAGGVALGPKRTARVQAQEDRRLQRYVSLTRRIEALETRIQRAEAREVRAA